MPTSDRRRGVAGSVGHYTRLTFQGGGGFGFDSHTPPQYPNVVLSGRYTVLEVDSELWQPRVQRRRPKSDYASLKFLVNCRRQLPVSVRLRGFDQMCADLVDDGHLAAIFSTLLDVSSSGTEDRAITG